MEVRTFEELIEWTRQLHAHLADCLKDCASQHQEERARMLLDYLACHEAELELIVAEFERQADQKALKTRLYDYLAHKPIETHRTCDGHYANLDYEGICKEVFDYHDQAIALYRELARKAEIPEARDLMQSLLEMEEHESMRLAQQVNQGQDF